MEELNALEQNETWEIVELPENKKPMGRKWVFTIKCHADGSIKRYKTRLGAKHSLKDTKLIIIKHFAHVAKINSIRVILSLPINSNWPLNQLDLKNAFLNGDLEEEAFFMSLPLGFEKEFGCSKICKLKKSLYGLKQSLRAWSKLCPAMDFFRVKQIILYIITLRRIIKSQF